MRCRHAMGNHTLVMKGSLDEFELPDVLQVVGGSRQHTLIELRESDGKRAGFIAMKAGQVLGCESKRARGRDAFFELFEEAAAELLRVLHDGGVDDPVGAELAIVAQHGHLVDEVGEHHLDAQHLNRCCWLEIGGGGRGEVHNQNEDGDESEKFV